MSDKDIAKNLIDQIPDSKMYYIIAYLQGAAIPNETPNSETIEAMQELENGGGHKFSGTIQRKGRYYIMPALQPQPNYLTLEQYETLSDSERMEVFEGVPCDMASPSELHQTILLELSLVLRDYIKRKNGPCKLLIAPFDVVLNDKPLTLVQPDIMIVCSRDKLDGKRCNGAPDFIVEVVSPNIQSDDYIRKLYYYKNYGVREYWIVDPRKKTVTVNYFEGDLLNEQYTFKSSIRVNIYGDLYVDFSELSGLF
jgi:Uma2 family endonuclease